MLAPGKGNIVVVLVVVEEVLAVVIVERINVGGDLLPLAYGCADQGRNGIGVLVQPTTSET